MPETTALLAQQWDMIFFTGSPPVGKIVHQAAAKNLTPCVLELGGKNPTIVHSSANLKAAARRIAYGRYINSGHICTAPDHVLAWPEVKDEFVQHMKDTIREFYGDDPKQSPDYGRVINRRNFDRLAALLGSGKAVAGGQTDPDELYIAPTVLVDVALDSPIMKEEVFGPILPVLEIDSVEAVIEWVNGRPSPLGLYVFAEDKDVVEQILSATRSGDAEVNDCAIHPLFPELPFGGVGNSGMGKYHGRWGFEAFTNARGVLHHSSSVDPGVRYPPYAKHELERVVVNKLTGGVQQRSLNHLQNGRKNRVAVQCEARQAMTSAEGEMLGGLLGGPCRWPVSPSRGRRGARLTRARGAPYRRARRSGLVHLG